MLLRSTYSLVGSLFILVTVARTEVVPDSRLTDREGLIGWYDADSLRDDTNAATGRDIKEWPDSSGNDHPAKADAGSYRPRLYFEGDPKTSAPYLSLDGIDDYLSVKGLGKPESVSLFLVVRPHSNEGGFRGLLSGASTRKNDFQTGFNIDLGFAGSEQWSFLNVEGAGAGGVANVLLSPRPFGQFHVVSIVFDRKAGVECHIDGAVAGSRPWSGEKLVLDEVVLGARQFRNEPGPAYIRSFAECDYAEVLIYDRTLDDQRRSSVERYLLEKHAPLLTGKPADLQTLRMLAPGFDVREIPIHVNNINDLHYDEQGKLWMLGYDGRVLVATDTDDDGLEDQVSVYWDRSPLRDPVALLVRPEGVYVSSAGKISRIVDHDGDGRGDEEVVVTSGWEPSSVTTGVDALGMAFDAEKNLYFGLGCAAYTNAYLLDNDKAGYSLASERGTVLKLSPDSQRSIVSTGVRFAVSMAFNRHGDLFVTDQEGETWLPGGNPLDELLQIKLGRHYGFPPKHPVHLPSVFDDPAVALYGPQHQSTCGLTFNEAGAHQPSFGPDIWEGDAIVSGYSRGKIWRTKLARTPAGYIGRTQLIGSARMLVVDAIVSPKGDLIVSAHSGQPDWGRGPTGPGTLFNVRYVAKELPQVEAIWPANPLELRVRFDRPVPEGATCQATIELGDAVRAGDRYELHRPGYESVRLQLLLPRSPLAVRQQRWEDDRRTLVLTTDPHPYQTHYAASLSFTGLTGAEENATYDVDYDLSGVEARRLNGQGDVVSRHWQPHLDSIVNETFLPSLPRSSKEAIAMELKTTFSPMMGPGKLQLSSMAPFQVKAGGDSFESTVSDSKQLVAVPVTQTTEITVTTTNASMDLTASYVPDADPVARPVPVESFVVPWAPTKKPASAIAPPAPPEIANGDWSRGREIFFSEQGQCSKCHRVRGEGGNFGPDLSNLVHRDAGSVRRDIVDPNAAINPDYVPVTLLLQSGEVLAGLVHATGGNELSVVDATAKERKLSLKDVDEYQPSQTSIMPTGFGEKLGAAAMRDLLTFLTTPEPKPPASAEGHKPPLRTRAEVDTLLKAIPPVDESTLRPLNIVLVAGPKDHDPGEHDYPIWQARWEKLLQHAPKTRVSTAEGWPSPAQWAHADVIVFYFWNNDWSKERYAQLDEYFKRGGGIVAIHSATIDEKAPDVLAEWIGLAFKPGPSKFRHGPLTLETVGSHSPITAGIKSVDFLDETYWRMFGEPSRINLLATAVEEGTPQPIVWTYERDGGRVFASILGHYLWTFDDPVFRTLVLRGMAWAAGEPESRFHSLVTDGVKFAD